MPFLFVDSFLQEQKVSVLHGQQPLSVKWMGAANRFLMSVGVIAELAWQPGLHNTVPGLLMYDVYLYWCTYEWK